jgi:hypothetical protein
LIEHARRPHVRRHDLTGRLGHEAAESRAARLEGALRKAVSYLDYAYLIAEDGSAWGSGSSRFRVKKKPLDNPRANQ